MNITNHHELPCEISLSFDLLFHYYQNQLLEEENELVIQHIKALLDSFKKYPLLRSGIKTKEELIELNEVIEFLMKDLFPGALSCNEIKAASIPFQPIHFYGSSRFESIIKAAGNDLEFKLLDFSEEEIYILCCNYILASFYEVNTDYQKPLYYSIPDNKGKIKTYRLALNGDFIAIQPKDEVKKLSEKDIDLLLQNYENIDLWKEKFPLNSWDLKGFLLINFIDVTHDTVISDLKSDMLHHTISNDSFRDFQENFKRFFNSPDLLLGFTKFNFNTNSFVHLPEKNISSFILGRKKALNCKAEFCDFSYDLLIRQKKYLSVSDIDQALAVGDHAFLRQFQNQGFRSCIIVPIVIDEILVASLEIASPHKNDLTSINASRLDLIMPYLIATTKRYIQERENYIKAIIQKECTAIHPSVLWKFEEEAEHFIQNTFSSDPSRTAMFKDIVFEHVYPLFGQIDIVGSSHERNKAIQADFVKQLELVKEIFISASKEEQLAFYKQIVVRAERVISEFKSDFNTTSEEQLLYFLRNEVNPIMPHIKALSPDLKAKVDRYEKEINEDTGVVYFKRKHYEDAVQFINTQLALLLDEKQKEAQDLYPHFFERFKTDGVEHNIYIGEALVKNKPYDKVYLKNLRLWQLTTMCEMERNFYEIQIDQNYQLHCASLVLVYGNSLSIRFRVDEKKFDVDGAYNARYEIIKKRIDKSVIKGTTERITQKGKLVIVYAQKKDELEYLRYVKYLQAIGYVEEEIEVLQVEDLQGVVGLKAIRAKIVYKN